MSKWQPIASAPKGVFHPYSDHPYSAEFVLVYNGHHRGVAYCLIDEDCGEQWLAEDGTFAPPPTHWMPLPEPPTD